jgi:hypothetical protein
MKMKIFLLLFGTITTVALIGCVETVSNRKTVGVPYIKDTIEGRYERPLDQVHQAALDVIKFNGTLVNESTIHSETNIVKTVEGRINQRNVWVRVEQVDPKVTSVKVQTRTPGGGSDIDLAHQVEKEIALKLVSR